MIRTYKKASLKDAFYLFFILLRKRLSFWPHLGTLRGSSSTSQS